MWDRVFTELVAHGMLLHVLLAVDSATVSPSRTGSLLDKKLLEYFYCFYKIYDFDIGCTELRSFLWSRAVKRLIF